MSRAFDVIVTAKRDEQLRIAEALCDFIRGASDGHENHVASSVLEAMARIDPTLIPSEVIEEFASAAETEKRICAVSLPWELAEANPGAVPLGLLACLAQPATEDWYVEAPAMAVTKLLMLRRRSAGAILDHLARSSDPIDRHAAAVALLDVSSVDPAVVPPSLVERLLVDGDDLVAAQARCSSVPVHGESATM